MNLQLKHGYSKTDLFSTSLVTSSSQGFDIYDNYLVQLYNNGIIQILNATTGAELSVIHGVGFQHGSTCQFSSTFYDASDPLPLMYTTSDTTPGIMYVIRFSSLNSASIVKKYKFEDEAGYFCKFIVDFENDIVYSLGYKANSYTSAPNNGTIISKYDLSQATEVESNTYTLALLERYEKPFIYCMQAGKFLNGMIYIVSSHQKTKLYVYDPVRRLYIAIFDNMPDDIANHEKEDLAFIEGSTKYEAIIATRTKYMKFTFAQ